MFSLNQGYLYSTRVQESPSPMQLQGAGWSICSRFPVLGVSDGKAEVVAVVRQEAAGDAAQGKSWKGMQKDIKVDDYNSFLSSSVTRTRTGFSVSSWLSSKFQPAALSFCSSSCLVLSGRAPSGWAAYSIDGGVRVSI